VYPQTPEIAHRRYRVRGMTVKRKGASVTKEEPPLIHKHNYTQEIKRSFTVVIRLRTENSRVRIPARIGDFSVLHTVQTGYGVHPASY
jgi:hypothetical protein